MLSVAIPFPFKKKFLCPAVQIYALQREDWTASFRFGYCQKLLSLLIVRASEMIEVVLLIYS